MRTRIEEALADFLTHSIDDDGNDAVAELRCDAADYHTWRSSPTSVGSIAINKIAALEDRPLERTLQSGERDR